MSSEPSGTAARIDLRQEDYNRAAQAFYGGKAMTTTHRPYNADDTHDVNITATLRRDVSLTLASDGVTRLPVLVVLSQGGHNYRFILRPDEARTLGADLIEKAGEATAITGLERLTRE